MRGRVAGRISQCSASLPQTLLQLSSSSTLTFLGPLPDLLSPSPPRSLSETSSSSSTSDGPPAQTSLGTGKKSLSEKLHSSGFPSLFTYQNAVVQNCRSISSSSSNWQGSLDQSSSALSCSSNGILGQLGRRRFSNASAEQTERRCWSCEHDLSTENRLFCSSCDAIQPLDPNVDFFQIFSV
jgi:hypothetical protein